MSWPQVLAVSGALREPFAHNPAQPDSPGQPRNDRKETSMDEAQESARPLTAMEIEEQRRAAAQAAPEEAPRMETFTYKDGSTRHGCAPFPKLSPIQEQAELNRKHAEAHGQHAAQGAPLEPVATTPPAGVVTAEQIAPSPAAAPEPTAKDLEAVAKAIEPTGEAVPEAAPAPAPKSTAKK